MQFFTAPFDFAKLHGCVPKHCACGTLGEANDSMVPATPPDIYLRPMATVVQDMISQYLNLVGSRNQFELVCMMVVMEFLALIYAGNRKDAPAAASQVAIGIGGDQVRILMLLLNLYLAS